MARVQRYWMTTHALPSYVLTQLITKALLGLLALLRSANTAACVSLHAYNFFLQIIQVKEKLNWRFLWLINYARCF